MATTTRQTAIFGTEDWKKLYKTYKEADFQSYNFETIRKTMVDYLRQHHPESFNDFTESSEYVAILNVMAFMGQSLAFRSDLNTRENFLDTAERRDSVTNLAKLVGYTPKRNDAASGYLKVQSVTTTENITDYNRVNLSNVTVRWNDKTNDDWQEQFSTVLNAALIDSQKIGQPGRSADVVGIKTDEYAINMTAGFLPVVPFNASVSGSQMDFELVNASSVNKNYIYEPAPKADAKINLLFRNDNNGYASGSTGYFFHFKQGSLQTQDFTLSERIANHSVEFDTDGVNNSDVWLFKVDAENAVVTDEWTEVENIYASNNSQLDTEDRKFFSVTSRAADQVTLNFGDGVFSDIPVGTYRSYLRESNGLEYVINAEELQNIDVSLSYTSRTGRPETITFTLSLTTPITNAKNRESLDDIKRRAPARFYTQNRMVNGEDYNNFPYTAYSSIIKSKAVNRTNIGASRYLDLVDPTGKYSSINTYASDGLIYKDESLKSFNFTFNDKNDIDLVFRNKVEPLLASRGTIQFYYENYSRIDMSSIDIQWSQSTTITNETTGFFKNSSDAPLSIGSFVNDNREYLIPNALIKFIAPNGYHFNATNKLVPGTVVTPEDKDEIWATIVSVDTDGTNQGVGNYEDGTGPVTLNQFVPTEAIPAEIIPVFSTDLPVALEQEMLAQVELLRNFGIRFDHLTNTWYIIAADDLDAQGDFSLDNAGSTNNVNEDASWIVRFISTPQGYEVSGRVLQYFFSSVLETRFFFDDSRQIFDPRTGKVVNDFIKVLKTNSKPDNNEPLAGDIIMDIIDQSVETDGYVNDYKVEISFTDSDKDGIADDPDYFNTLVNAEVDSTRKNVYFQSTVDFDNLERYLPIASDTVNAEYATEADIALVKTENVNGQIFYAYTDDAFYELVVDGIDRSIVLRTDYNAQTGRDKLHFQYKHNSPETRRINPSVTNIIDIFVVTASYYEAFTRYIQDNTNTVEKPIVPTTDELTVQYEKLQDSKMVSDNVVMNSVKFKALFGDKADDNLQAYIKVVKLNNVVTSDSEIKSNVISAINEYFDIDNWDFGDTFFFSELSAYLHSKLGDVVGSIVIIPKDPLKTFGDLYEIKSAPHEIFVSAATVNDVNIIDALTVSKLQNGAV